MKKLLLLLFSLMLSFNSYGDCFEEYLKDAPSNNFENTIKICTPLAQNGDAWSQEILGGIYYDNDNFKEALKWSKKSAMQGFAPAQLRLGLMYELGQGILKDYKQAVNWYRKSAEQGNRASQNNMGFMYEIGRGVLKNYKVSASWYQKAADAGSATAQVNLGIYYCNGQGVDKDLSMSKILLLKAYESGDLTLSQQDWVEGVWERCKLANY